MQCKDCLREIDEKEYFNRNYEGICKKCRQKMSQIKYENKKFGTNKQYVPARLKKNNSFEELKEEPKEKELKETNVEKKIYGSDIEEKVLKDISETFATNKVNIDPQEYPPFHIFIDLFCSLIDLEKGYMKQYEKAEDVFNRMECDYQHAYEDASDPESFMERSKMFRCLLDQRRTVKNGLAQYEKVTPLLQEIVKKCPNILKLAKDTETELNRIIELQGGHSYMARASELIAKEDFCIGKKDISARGKYHVTVPVFGYYGNNSPYLFERDCWADNPKKAIETIVKYLKAKFPNVTYKTGDFEAKIAEESTEETVYS